MFRIALFTVVSSVAVSSVAPAQYMPGFRPGLYVTNPYTGASFGYNLSYGTSIYTNYVNPYTGVRSGFAYQTQYSGPAFPSAFNASPLLAYGYGAGYLTGGVGSYSSSTGNPAQNPIVLEQLRLLRAAGAMGNANDVEARKMIADQWAYEQQVKNAVAQPAEAPFQNVDEQQITSGNVLNRLAAAIRVLEGKTGKTESPLLPAELINSIQFAPGASADVVTALRAGRTEFPEVLTGQEWMALRNDLGKAIAPVMEAAVSGKRVPASAGEKLAAEVKKARAALAPTSRELGFQQATELNRFLNQLDSLAKIGTDTNLNGVYIPQWTTVGATVSEVVKHMAKYQLSFSASQDGGEEAYDALYRGMATYHAALAAKK